MRPLDALRLAVRGMRQNPVRIVLTVLALGIGIGAIITVVSSGLSGYGAIHAELWGLGINRVWITSVHPGALTAADAQLLSGVSTQMRLETTLLATQTLQTRAGVSRTARVIGCTQTWLEMENAVLREGRFLRGADVAQSRHVAVIGADAAYALFGRESALGQQISLLGAPYTVVGVIEPIAALQTAQTLGVVLAPISALQERLGTDRIDEIALWVGGTEQVEQVAALSLQRLERKLGEGAVVIKTLKAQMESAGQIQRIFIVIMSAVALVCMLVGGIGVMNIMLAGVRERKREIGVAKALGARGTDILAQFLVEALLYALAGGLLGVLVGRVFTRVVASMLDLPQTTPLWVIGMGILFATLLGVFFGVYPARRAARLQVVEALRGGA